MKKNLFQIAISLTAMSLIACYAAKPHSANDSGSQSSGGGGTPGTTSGPFQKIFIVILENSDQADAGAQPYLKSLLAQGGSFSDYNAVTFVSQPNYIAITSGDQHGVTGDGDVNLNVKHIADLLEAKGKTWKTYAEDYPGNCFTGTTSGKYVRKHNPFISYINVQNNPARCANIVNSSQLTTDIQRGTLPDFALYIPNQDNNGHDTNVTFADNYMKNTFDPLLHNHLFMKNMLLVITFDEASAISGALGKRKIYTVLLGDGVVPGSKSPAHYDHYSMLRTVEDRFGLGTLGLKDSTANPIGGVWK